MSHLSRRSRRAETDDASDWDDVEWMSPYYFLHLQLMIENATAIYGPGRNSLTCRGLADAIFASLMWFGADMPTDLGLHGCLEQRFKQTFQSVAIVENFLH